MSNKKPPKPVEILLVADSKDDARLMEGSLLEGRLPVNVNTIDNGEAAIQYLRRQHEYKEAIRPDLILLDLQLPRKNRREVLTELKEDPDLKFIPIVILSSSETKSDYDKAWDHQATCWVAKPIDHEEFAQAVKGIEDFWLNVAEPASRESPRSDDETKQPVEILLVEDSKDDARLMEDALLEGRLSVNVNTVDNGEAAIHYVRRQHEYKEAKRPDLILLDLHLPRKNGHEVLTELKEDADLKQIPVVILSSSERKSDFDKAWDGHANCCVKKPIDHEEFAQAVKEIENFWLNVAKRAPRRRPGSAGEDSK